MKYVAPIEVRTQVGNLRYLDELRNLSKKQRNKSTIEEILFWKKIKNDALGYRFLRQKAVGRFIIDFYCSKLMLAVEIDGSSHISKLGSDEGRDKYLLVRGILTVRYKNDEIVKNINKVVNNLRKVILVREVELSLSSKGEGPAAAGPEGF